MGHLQLGVILTAAFALFQVPMEGSFLLLSGFMFPFRAMREVVANFVALKRYRHTLDCGLSPQK